MVEVLALVLGSITAFMVEFVCKNSSAFKGYLVDFIIIFFLKQSYYQSVLKSSRALPFKLV